jgi:hypothetical protein
MEPEFAVYALTRVYIERELEPESKQLHEILCDCLAMICAIKEENFHRKLEHHFTALYELHSGTNSAGEFRDERITANDILETRKLYRQAMQDVRRSTPSPKQNPRADL